jgi:hypothetical protein
MNDHICTNDNVRDEISRMIARISPGDEVHSSRICQIVNGKKRTRGFTNPRITQFLKERDDLERIGSGIWRKKVLT